MAVLGERGDGTFPIGMREWDEFRKVIAVAYRDTDFKIRLSRNFDDICVGCARKKEKGHPEKLGTDDAAYFKLLGIEPGAIIRLWDALKLVEDNFSAPFIERMNTFLGSEASLNCFMRFLSPDAKFHANSDEN
jgi:hypothetical protein